MTITRHMIERALALDAFDGVKAHRRMAPTPRPTRRQVGVPGKVRLGAVLLLLYERQRAPHFVLTRRPDTLRAHAGQISLPGGQNEPPESLPQTAIRETFEELGIRPGAVTLLGELAAVYIPPSDFEVHPYVGWHTGVPHFTPAAAEVAEVIELPVANLFAPGTRREEQREFRGQSYTVPYFQIGEHKVWGATAMMVSEFAARLERVVMPL